MAWPTPAGPGTTFARSTAGVAGAALPSLILLPSSLPSFAATALIAALAAPIAAYALGRPDVAIMSGLLAALIYWLHRANIQRILKGEEPRIGDKKKSEQENGAETEEN